MFRRTRLLPLLLALALPLLASGAQAAPVRPGGDAALDGRFPGGHVAAIAALAPPRGLPRVRLVTAEVVILPSGRMVTRPAAALPLRTGPAPRPGADLIVLPLPAAMPLFLAAIAGLALAGRRRRTGHPLAGVGKAP